MSHVPNLLQAIFAGAMLKPTIRSLTAKERINQLVNVCSLDRLIINQATTPFPVTATRLTARLLYVYHNMTAFRT